MSPTTAAKATPVSGLGKKKAPPGDGAEFGAFCSDGHGVILAVAVAFDRLELHVLGVGPDRREAVEHGVRDGRE